MLDAFDLRKDAMPDEMKLLLARYPRAQWDGHPGFGEQTRHWLGAHIMFRRLAGRVRQDSEAMLDRKATPEAYAGALSYFGGALVGNLHGHHGWEDQVYFPELSAADPRFDRGLELLEKDHAALDRVLDSFTASANRVIKLAQLDPEQAREEAAQVHRAAETIEAFLHRHLSDEEELAVPIILHHRLRG